MSNLTDLVKDVTYFYIKSFSVENILLEMFADPELSKHRVYLEIMNYQNSI